DLKKIKFLINLDLLGTGDDGIMVTNGYVYEKEFNLLDQINKESNLVKETRSVVPTNLRVKSEATVASETRFKEKQAEYRKQAYQAQKERAKEYKAARSGASEKSSKSKPHFPAKVEAALKYFEVNGFPMELPASDVEINQAKRVLSRVFHPDKGGTHEEIVELLKHAEVLLQYR
ncbi:MAG: hypothetical protein V4692_04215, partial [Bdellovibrionota bacterium]